MLIFILLMNKFALINYVLNAIVHCNSIQVALRNSGLLQLYNNSLRLNIRIISNNLPHLLN